MEMKMNRYIINKIRYVLEDVIPPILRDSIFFYLIMKLFYKDKTNYLIDFKENINSLTKEDYSNYYKHFPPIMGETDLNQECINLILKSIVGDNIIDVGCGRGFLINEIFTNLHKKPTGCDIIIPDDLKNRYPNFKFIEAAVEKLPFNDCEFDTVICAHTLEHILDFSSALNELRRITNKRLIIIVPMEREYKYSFNFHLQFFPYKRSFINRAMPHDLNKIRCHIADGDIFYIEDK